MNNEVLVEVAFEIFIILSLNRMFIIAVVASEEPEGLETNHKQINILFYITKTNTCNREYYI